MDPTAASCFLRTADHCRLAIGAYPFFTYNASGGGGRGTLSRSDAEGHQSVVFPAEGLQVPPLNSRTGRWLGVPLPPGLRIAILPERFDGELHGASGTLRMRFKARFRFRVGSLLHPPDLIVETCLSTGESHGTRHGGAGQSLDVSGEGQLVGVATVPACGTAWLDRFLGLPDEALAVLRFRLERNVPPETSGLQDA